MRRSGRVLQAWPHELAHRQSRRSNREAPQPLLPTKDPIRAWVAPFL